MTEMLEHLEAETISAHVDGELGGEEQLRVRKHLEGCADCALRVLSATQLKAATAQAGRRYTPSPDTLSRLTAGVLPQPAATAPANARSSMPRAAWGALAAGLVLAISLIGWRALHPSNGLAAELLDQHLATLSNAAAPQVLSSDRHTVKPWFQGRLPFSFNLPEHLPADMTLKGADFSYLEGKPTALLLFTIHKHEASVFLTQASGSRIRALPSHRSGFSIIEMSTRELDVVAVSDVNEGDLDALVSALVQVQAP